MYWDGLTLGARKRRTFVLKAQAATNLTAGSTLAVGAAGYVAGNDCGVPAAQGVYTLTVQAAGWANKKAPRLSPRAECGINPVVDPTVPYSLYALNQKCVEGERVTVSDRRLAGAESEAASEEEQGGEKKSRALNGALVITEDECWQACSANGYADGSFFYVYSPGSGRDDECYCCATCTPVYAQGTSVYRMNEAAPQAELCGTGACATCSAGCRRELSVNPGGCQLSMYTPQSVVSPTNKDECIQGAFCVCHYYDGGGSSVLIHLLSCPYIFLQRARTTTTTISMRRGTAARAIAKRQVVVRIATRVYSRAASSTPSSRG